MHDPKLQELFQLLEEQEKKGPVEGAEEFKVPGSKEELLKELLESDKDEVLVGEQAAMAEYAIMMRQWDALVADYERREAEEKAEAKGKDA